MQLNLMKSAKAALGAQYFLYFGIMGIFLPYFNLYCYHLNFNGMQIGILSAIRSGTLVIFPVIWGILADRFSTRRPMYIVCNIVGAVLWSLFLFTDNFNAMMIIMLVHGFFYAPIIAFLEASTMDVLESKEKGSYGSIRAWGSISFIIIVMVMGKAIDFFSVKIILIAILILSLIYSIISFGLPEKRTIYQAGKRYGAGVILNTGTIIFLISAFLMLVSHGGYYAFFSIHLERLGYENTFIGLTWAVASTAEIIAMLKSESIFKRCSLEHVMLFSFTVAAFRWILLIFIQSPAAILLSQVLHAMTYGTFHMASVIYMDRLMPAEAKNLGQSINNSLTYGFGLMVGFFISGYLFEQFGISVMFMAGAIIAATGGALFGFYYFAAKTMSLTNQSN
ncbi:MAG: MFS transporter [Desulfobacterales bacterium]|nr:MFS transporter [Desulfobacterales bacterium]